MNCQYAEAGNVISDNVAITTPNLTEVNTLDVMFYLPPFPGSSQDNNRRAHAHARVPVHNVLVIHPKTSVRDEAADRSRIVGAVDGVLAAATECQGCRTHRVRRAATRNDRRQPGIVLAN